MILDQLTARAENEPAAVNPAAGRENPNKLADSRPSGIFYVRHTPLVRPVMAGRGGNTFGYAGSSLPVSHIPPCARHPDREKSAASLTLKLEAATMPSITRALSRLFPVSARRLAFAMYRRNAISAVTLVRMIGGAA